MIGGSPANRGATAWGRGKRATARVWLRPDEISRPSLPTLHRVNTGSA